MSIIYFPTQGGSNLLYYQRVKGEAGNGLTLSGQPEASQVSNGLEINLALADSIPGGMELGELAVASAPGGMETESGETLTILLEAIDENLAAGRGDC